MIGKGNKSYEQIGRGGRQYELIGRGGRILWEGDNGSWQSEKAWQSDKIWLKKKTTK